VTAESGDHRATAIGSYGRLRASHADRERAIEVLKQAFVQGRLTRHELDSRVGQAFASRTYAELAAVTADIPAEPTAGPPPRQPAHAQHRAPRSRTARDLALGSGLGLIFLAAVSGGLLQYTLLLVPMAVMFAVAAPFLVIASRSSSQQRGPGGQLPPPPGQGPQASKGPRPGQVGHDLAPPGVRPDQTRADHACADLRTDSSRPRRPHPSGLAAQAPRGIRPVPDAL
jgi:Domain of unknown function (DUF1707)